jgi:hypothetical protein
MSSFVRASKFRHVFSDPPRIDSTYTNLRLATVTGEQCYIKANPLYFAVALQVRNIYIFIFILIFNYIIILGWWWTIYCNEFK